MRFIVLALALIIALPVSGQDKAVKKKSVAKKQAVHKKPTPEQIRKFNQLRKQREAKG